MKLFRIVENTRDGLKLCEEADLAQPVGRQVLVRVRASSLNFKDKFLFGEYGKTITAPGGIPLCEAAGEVMAIGPDVTLAGPGDRVALTYHWDWIGGDIPDTLNTYGRGSRRHDGTLTEMMLVDESEVVQLPDHLSFEEAATLPCAGVTAWAALHDAKALLPGETVLIQGTGGVSVLALQFAKLSGARVIATTTSIAKMDTLRQLGADVIIDASAGPGWHKDVLAATKGRGVDLTVDVLGSGHWADTIPASRQNGRISFVGSMEGWSEGQGQDLMRILFMKGLRSYQTRVGSREHFLQMNRAIDAHKVQPIVDRVFDFDDAPAAFDYLHAGGSRIGKIVIRHN